MGRYSEYFKDVWKLQQGRKIIGLSLFGVIFDNTTPFTPGNQLSISDDVAEAIKLITQKGHDFLVIMGQPPSRTKNLDLKDFENILGAFKEIVESLGGRVRNNYYSPSTEKTDPYVKPNTGMFERAANENPVKWDETFYIGADMNDVKAATKMKSTPILISGLSKQQTKNKAFELTNQIKIKEYGSLLEFAKTL
jgi:HAD superfamily hydrolase (TIGR01662 family)